MPEAPNPTKPSAPTRTPPATDLTRGLTEAEAARRLAQDGPNLLPRGTKRGFLATLIEVVAQPMLGLLIAASALYLTLGDVVEGVALLIAVVGVIAIALFQSRRTERALEALRDLSSPRAQVLRDGLPRTVPAKDLVVGDLIRLGEGDRVPADAISRIGTTMRLDESLLTGESVPVTRHPDLAATQRPPPGGDGHASVFSGTLVVAGRSVAEVVATGARTELGKIGKTLESTTSDTTPLQREVDSLVKRVAVLAVSFAVILLLIRGLSDGEWLPAILAGITLAMSLLPEEFPVVLTVFLALGAWRLSRHGVLTRRVMSVETLGEIDVLCTDKTGTLTENRMRIEALWPVSGSRFPVTADLPEAVHELVEYGILACPRDPFDPMEKAFHDLGARALAQTEHVHPTWEDLREYPLTPELLAVTHAWRTSGVRRTRVVATKGAPEAVFALCRLTDPEPWRERVTTLAKDGLRVLAIAAGETDTLPDDPRALTFRFLGLVALADPLRADVPDAVALCKAASIHVVMITGDHPDTALAIARQAGITPSTPLLGPEIDALSDEALADRLVHTTVIARAVPTQKLRIVQALRARGLRVAMTGDGVNDAPALRAADIGVAMGARGTDVAREAAHLVLTDDDFGAIVHGIRLGRRIFDNLRRAFGYLVSVHLPIAGLALVPALLGWPQLIGPLQVVVLELIIDPASSIVFELEPADERVMDRAPRKSSEHIFTRRHLLWSLALGLVAFAGVFTTLALQRDAGASEASQRSLALVTLVVGNLALLLASRSDAPFWHALRHRKNRGVPILIAATLALVALIVFLPPLRDALSLGPLVARDLALTFAFGVLPVLALDALKGLQPKAPKATTHP